MVLNIFDKEKRILKNSKQKISFVKKQVKLYESQKLSSVQLKEEYKSIKNEYSEIKALALFYILIKKELNISLYDVQLIAAISMSDSRIIEMKTGEGKTFVAILNSFLSHLKGNKVYLVTANEYLAKRDAEIANNILSNLGIKTSFVSDYYDFESKKTLYESDIVYLTMKTLIFDFLKSNLHFKKEHVLVDRMDHIIIDEADLSLIDEARNPLNVTGESDNDDRDFYLFNRIAENFIENEDFFVTKDGIKSVTIQDEGYQKLELKLISLNLISDSSELYIPKNIRYIELIKNAIKANYAFKEGVDYVISKDNVVIINKNTGRLMEGSRLKNGLHQAIEAKERLTIKNESKILSSITIQSFLKKFKFVSGMTGTAYTDKKELAETYNMDVIRIPSNKNNKRIDRNDYIFYTKTQKNKKIIEDIILSHKVKRPILIGTNTIEYSEELSLLLKKEGISHNILNAKNHEEEAHIISMAGRLGSITIATNMAGRGTDIKLAGDESVISEYMRNGLSFEMAKQKYKDEYKRIKELGGLLIIGAERNELQRIDNQLRGRSGRQGDEGETRFYISLDDDLIVNFSDNTFLKTYWEKLNLTEESVENKFVSNSINRIQRKIDGNFFDMRKNLILFDEINENQRNIIFNLRNNIINSDDIFVFLNNFLENPINRIVDKYTDSFESGENWKLVELEKYIKKVTLLDLDLDSYYNKNEFLTKKDISEKIKKEYIVKLKSIFNKSEDAKDVIYQLILRAIDVNWSNQIEELETIRKNTNFRSFAQEKPLDEYKKEMFSYFNRMLFKIENEMFETLCNAEEFIKKEVHEMDYEEFYTHIIRNISGYAFGISPFFRVGI